MGLTGGVFLRLPGSWQEGTRPASLSSSSGDSQSGQSSSASSSCCSCGCMWSLWLGTCSLSWPLVLMHVSTHLCTSSLPACPVQTSSSLPKCEVHCAQGLGEHPDSEQVHLLHRMPGSALLLFDFWGHGHLSPGTMAYDCYVAICHPLHYKMVMSRRCCTFLVTACWILTSLVAMTHTFLIFRLSFCSRKIIP
ncbi:unnamed protein product, partial [Gulo gulo]